MKRETWLSRQTPPLRHRSRPHECGQNRNGSQRSGLSVLEFIGCLIAVVGGMWFGAVYLGVDVDRVTYEAVRDIGLMDKLPENFKPTPPPGHPDSISREQLASMVQDELVALREEISALRNTAADPKRSPSPDEPPTDPTQPTAARTLAYWKLLSEIALDEAALQAGAQSALTEANADRVFSLRGRVSRFAAKTVEAIPADRVDPQVTQLGQQLADWYIRGGDLYDQGAHLWSDENAQKSSAQLTRRWETAERQLRNEARLLSNKAASVQATLVRKYGVEFPAFGG